jgi:glycine/D-amino acid oxidase-like deaminating enzyme
MRSDPVSHWFSATPASRPALPGDRDADVCIVGAGFSGLWTAYYLKRADPSLRIVVLEARYAGFGASGRNGGWASGLVPGDRNRMAQVYGRAGVMDWQRALNDSVDEIVEVARREGIEADIVKSGTLQVARKPAQHARLLQELEQDRYWGIEDAVLLTKVEARQRIRIDRLISAGFTPHCARIQPAALVRGLAEAVERLGVTIYESTPVTRLASGRASTPHGILTAPVVLRATEGFTASLPGLRRKWLPMNSSMIATEPITPDVWESIGWEGRETVGDEAHGFFYAQRTADDRIAIGGRVVPYRFGSRTDNDGRVSRRTVARLRATLTDALPQTRGVRIARGWCGVLGVPRDWEASVGMDAATGLGWAGGYVGHGVTATNLAGRTLADLVLRRDTPLTGLPWVNHRARNWEPEPLRWLGVRGMYTAYKLADCHEARGIARTSVIARAADLIARRPS